MNARKENKSVAAQQFLCCPPPPPKLYFVLPVQGIVPIHALFPTPDAGRGWVMGRVIWEKGSRQTSAIPPSHPSNPPPPAQPKNQPNSFFIFSKDANRKKFYLDALLPSTSKLAASASSSSLGLPTTSSAFIAPENTARTPF